MRRVLSILLVFAATLGATGTARAVVVDDGAAGKFGVALIPGVVRWTGLNPVTAPAPCQDPWLAADLGGPILASGGLCYHGGAVIHRNEVFDVAWDPLRRDWATTRNFVEQYLRNVASSSGSLGTPYAITPQYRDAAGRAENQSTYGGGCIDYGHGGGAACQFGDTSGNAPGNDYPASGCPIGGINQFGQTPQGQVLVAVPNDLCLTDAQIQGEVTALTSQAGFLGRTHAGYSPLVVLMTPPGVVACLDGSGALCSSNFGTPPDTPVVSESDTGGTLAKGPYKVEVTEQLPTGETIGSAPASVDVGSATGQITVTPPPPLPGATEWSVYVASPSNPSVFQRQAVVPSFAKPFVLSSGPNAGPHPPVRHTFCSYHSAVTVGGVRVPYVVQPWTALTGCDEPDIPQIPRDGSITPNALATAVGARLVSPISQAELAAVTNPNLDGWSALDGSEINDNGYPNGCVPLAHGLDGVTVGGTSYFLQREFNNGGVIETDPNALGCEGASNLQAQFVAPSNADSGDVVEFDGSKTVSTLAIPRAGYVWDFGDGSSAAGPSVVHTFTQNGTYTVKLTVTDRGGYTSTLSQTIQIGPSITPPPPGPGKVTLQAHLQLLPQSLQSVLRSGLAVRITSNLKADGLTTLSLPRAYANRLHLRVARRASSLVIGRGTLAGVRAGTMTVHVRVPAATARRLARLHRVAFNLQVTLRGPSRTHQTIDVAGRY